MNDFWRWIAVAFIFVIPLSQFVLRKFGVEFDIDMKWAFWSFIASLVMFVSPFWIQTVSPHTKVLKEITDLITALKPLVPQITSVVNVKEPEKKEPEKKGRKKASDRTV
jgi:hypothetical protein